MLSKEELKTLSQLNPWRSSGALALDWLGIFACLATVSLFPHPVTFLLVYLIIPRFQYGLAIMMHDGAHGRLFQNVKTNDRLGQWLTAAPLFFSMDSYRVLHLKHHRDPLTKEDPDLGLTGGYPITKKSFWRKIFRDAVGISYFKFIKYFIYQSKHHRKSPTPLGGGTLPLQKNIRALSSRELAISILLMNFLIFSFLWALGHPGYYFFFWFVPMATILQVYLRIRGVSEHAGYTPNEDQRFNTRTILPSWQTLIFAPHKVGYHIEHHLYTSVPYYRLAQVHTLLKQREALPEANVFDSYSAVFAEIVR